MEKPAGDFRYRTHLSVILWVLEWDSKNYKVPSVEVVDEIERVVKILESREGRYVTYKNRYHKIHPKQEFINLLERFDSGEIHFYSNIFGVHMKKVPAIRNLVPAPFVYG